MEYIVDIKNAVYKERLVRCRDCRKKYACITFEGIANEDGYCSLGESEADRKTEPSEHRDCINCEDASDCAKCRGIEDEPQTEEHCETCRHKDKCEGATYEYKNNEWWCLGYAPIEDEPQTERSE